MEDIAIMYFTLWYFAFIETGKYKNMKMERTIFLKFSLVLLKLVHWGNKFVIMRVAQKNDCIEAQLFFAKEELRWSFQKRICNKNKIKLLK